MIAECKHDGCVRDAYRVGYCNAHYLRDRRGKDMDAAVRGPLRSALDRFVDYIDYADSGCWEWTSWTNGVGYGKFYVSKDETKAYAHRWVHEQVVGPIPKGLTIDHLCRNVGCVNPDHLEVVSQAVNTARSTGPAKRAARLAAITHCPRGHEYTPENTYRWAGRDFKGRTCKACARDRASVNRAKLNREKQI